MKHEECFQLGRITKPFGIRGQVVLFLDVDDPTQYSTLDTVLVDEKGTLAPHFLHIDSMNGNKAVATFEDEDGKATEHLIGHDLYLPLSVLPPLTGNKFYFHEIIGFDIVDRAYGALGKIQSVIDYPAQPLFQIDHDGTEILIPIIDPVIEKVDREGHTIYIIAPPGLVELYLEEKKLNI